MAHLYPVFLNLEHKTVLIVGGGTLARQKLNTLAPTGASVVLVAPEIGGECEAILPAGRLTLRRRSFLEADLERTDLVFAATDSAETNHRIVELARQRGIPANAVDDPEFCDFYTPAVVRRGMVSLAISTDGRFPGLTRAVREVLDEWLPEDADTLVDALADLRTELRRSNLPHHQRAQVLHDLIAQTRDRYLKPAQTHHVTQHADGARDTATRREGTQDDYYIS